MRGPLPKASAAAILCLAILAASGCQRECQGVYLEISGRLFVFNYRVATANYLVTLRRVAPIPEGSRLQAQFENPRGGEALVADEAIIAADDRIALSSPFVECVKKDRPYKVDLQLVDAKGDLLQKIETSVVSDVDQSVLPTKPLVVGPVYTPNPEVFAANGATDYGTTSSCPE
jgi:hypothetical protein